MSQSTLTIAPPDPSKPPLRANVFSHARSANTALCPMFPYLGDGDMVPATTLFYGGKDRDTGVFNHWNTVDEVVVMFGVEGAHARAGDVFVGGREHIVRSGFEDPEKDEAVMLVAVTQRQSEAGEPQQEYVSHNCDKCQNVLMMHKFEAQEVAPADPLPGYTPAFLTVIESVARLDSFNANESERTCGKCGHVNPPFPLDLWGWKTYRDSLFAAERSRSLYFSSVADMAEA